MENYYPFMRECIEIVRLQSEWLPRMLKTYLSEEMWWLHSFTRIWWCLQWGSRGRFNIKKIQNQMPKNFGALMKVVGTQIFQGHKCFIRSQFGMLYTPSEPRSTYFDALYPIGNIYSRSTCTYCVGVIMPKKRCSRSWGHENL